MHLRRSHLALFTLATGLLGCPTPTVTSDASTSDAFVTPDAGPDFDPSEVHWAEVELPTTIPSLWGWATAELPDGTAIVTGGMTDFSGTVPNTTWRVDARAEPITATTLGATAPPPERWCGCATYDAARGRVIVAGGRNIANVEGLPPDTWTLDVASDTWAELPAANTPASVIGCNLAYAAATRATYFFGGLSGAAGVSDDLYKLRADGTSWERIEATGPTPRYDGHLEAIEGGRQLLLFGGSYGAAGAGFYSDVWRFDTSTERWTEVVVEGDVPPGRRSPWLRMWNDGRGFYMGFGFNARMQPIGDLFYFDLATATWTPIELEVAPPARGFSAGMTGPAGSIGMLFPGLAATTPLRDAWQLVPGR
jgi:hypothetical protein